MPERAYLSIGEVLALLKDEFADITISKIRFLESQGLIEPERTPSGYRKFYEADVELLRLILREQREHFLPLRIIKDRIDSGAIEAATPPRGTVNPHPADRYDEEPPAATVAKHPAAGRSNASVGALSGSSAGSGLAGRRAAEQLAPTPASIPRPVGDVSSPSTASSPRLLPGVVVNRERIEEAPLANGDEVQIGAFKLVFFAGSPRG